MDDNFASIVQAVKWGRNIYDSVRKFIMFQLTVNIVAVVSTFVAALILDEAILSTVQMLWINLIMDSLAALALATEPPTEELLLREPYKKTDYIISPIMFKHMIGQAVFQVTVLMIFVFYGHHFLHDRARQRQLQPGTDLIVNGYAYYGYDRHNYNYQYSVHGTYVFNVFVMLQVFNFINARVIDDSLNIFKNITHSSMFLVIVAVILFGQVLLITFGGEAMKLVPMGLDFDGWLLCISVAAIGLLVSVALKVIPFDLILPQYGNKDIEAGRLRAHSALSIKRLPSKRFQLKQQLRSAIKEMKFLD